MDNGIALVMLQTLRWLCFVLGWLLLASLIVLGINTTFHQIIGRLGMWLVYVDFLNYWFRRHQGKHWFCVITNSRLKREREVSFE